MSDTVGLILIAVVILCGVIGVVWLTKPYEITTEEFEKRAHEAPSLMSAGFSGLQKILDPAAARAEETQQDFKQGFYDGEQESGDGPEAGDARL